MYKCIHKNISDKIAFVQCFVFLVSVLSVYYINVVAVRSIFYTY